MLLKDFSSWPHYDEDEIAAVCAVLRSGRVNAWTGREIAGFEREFADYVGTQHAVAVANGSVAIELALRALGIGKGDEVLVTSRSFLASASSIVNVGARPVFCDVELDSQNISARTIEERITERSRAIICVHLAGWPCEMDEIVSLARKRELFVIEDCAQAHGARYRGKSVGSLGDAATWSFCQDKIMSTGGEGGMVTTNSQELHEKMWSYKDHGKSLAAVAEAKAQQSRRFKWLHRSFGTNWRMTEMQAAIGRLQLKKMPVWHRRRSALAKVLDEVVDRFKLVQRHAPPEHIEHAFYKYYFFVDEKALAPGWSRDRIVEAMWEAKVPCLGGSCSEMYLEEAFEGTGFRPETPLLNAHKLGESSLMMLVHPTLKDVEIERMAKALSSVLEQAQAVARAS